MRIAPRRKPLAQRIHSAQPQEGVGQHEALPGNVAQRAPGQWRRVHRLRALIAAGGQHDMAREQVTRLPRTIPHRRAPAAVAFALGTQRGMPGQHAGAMGESHIAQPVSRHCEQVSRLDQRCAQGADVPGHGHAHRMIDQRGKL